MQPAPFRVSGAAVRTVTASLAGCLVGCLLGATTAHAQSNETFRSWNQPVEPFRIAGNLYYVGANDITAFLLTTDDGHIVIDGGFEETAQQIRDNIRTLGFDPAEVEILLNSHAHFDHAAGLAALAAWTGAEVWISAPDAPLIESGGAGDHLLSAEDNAFPPVGVARRLADGDTVERGGTRLTAHLTGGHTRGCTTWSTTVRDGDRDLHVVSICSLSVLDGVDLLHNEAYPTVADDFARSFATLRALPCDVFLASHGRFFGLDAKRAALETGTRENPFIDPEGYRRFVDQAEKRFEKAVAAQREEAANADRAAGDSGR